MNQNCKGHTLVELLIAIPLSMLIFAALLPLNMITLRSIAQTQQIERQMNLLGQSINVIENDLKTAALTACAQDKTLIINNITGHNSSPDSKPSFNWLSGYSNSRWFPQLPVFVNNSSVENFDSLHFSKVDMIEPINMESMAKTPRRIVFITDCMTSEIARFSDSRILKSTVAHGLLTIYAFQSVQYFVRESLDRYTLYRQYLTRSGGLRIEPLVDDIKRLSIGYAERIENKTLAINTAANVKDWSNVVAVYISISLAGDINHSLSVLVTLDNHASIRS